MILSFWDGNSVDMFTTTTSRIVSCHHVTLVVCKSIRFDTRTHARTHARAHDREQCGRRRLRLMRNNAAIEELTRSGGNTTGATNLKQIVL